MRGNPLTACPPPSMTAELMQSSPSAVLQARANVAHDHLPDLTTVELGPCLLRIATMGE